MNLMNKYNSKQLPKFKIKVVKNSGALKVLPSEPGIISPWP